MEGVDADILAQAAEQTKADVQALLGNAPPAGDPATLPFEPQVRITLLSCAAGMQVEIDMLGAEQPDERNPCHVLAWYIANGVQQLLPVAINSWHLQRLAMAKAAQQQSQDGVVSPDVARAGSSAIAGATGLSLVGADGRPIGG